MPPTQPALRIRTGQRPSKTRSAGSSSTCQQGFAPRCELFHLSVRTRRVLSGQGSSPQADSARSSVTSKQVSPSSTGADPDSSGNPRALRPNVLRHRPQRRRERSSVRKRSARGPAICTPSPCSLVAGRAESGPGYGKHQASWTKASDSHPNTVGQLCTTWRPASSALSRSTMWSHWVMRCRCHGYSAGFRSPTRRCPRREAWLTSCDFGGEHNGKAVSGFPVPAMPF
jgi:hypothetical protein